MTYLLGFLEGLLLCPKRHFKTATGESYKEIVEGYTIFDKEIPIPGDYTLKYEYSLNEKDYEAREIEHTDRLHFEKIEPSEFRIFELERG